MNTELSQKNVSRSYPTNIAFSLLEFVLLTGIGAIGVLIHAKFRLPLHIPGHWGIVFMTLLFSGRLFSQKKYASSLSSLGAAFMLLMPLGFKDPFMPVIYMLPGLFLDVFFNIFKSKNKHIVFVVLLSGLAYVTIPFIRIIITLVSGFFYGSFINGFMYPIIMHFLFGAAGGLIAWGAFTLIRKKF
ncbi:MAG: hypothetical protein WCQ95_07640 [Bacteroidota bacterium]